MRENAREERIGEERMMNCGLMAKIIRYQNNKDIDIEFENGTIVRHRDYAQFKREKIVPPDYYKNKYLNEERIMTCGLKAKIIEYRNINDIDIQFEDGVIVKHKQYNCFKQNQIRYPVDNRLGEEKIMSCGLKAKIIEYISGRNVTIQFEDGTIVKNKRYDHFKIGNIHHPDYCKNKRLNEELIMNCGLKAKIIEYISSQNITIQFKDGTIVKNKTYDSFKKGTIAYPNYYKNKHLNEEKNMNCGLKAKIIVYRNCNDIDIQFEDGLIFKHRVYQEFKEGKIKHPNYYKYKRLNEEQIMDCGLKAKIIEYRNANDIDIQFEDGIIVKHKNYQKFKKGKIRNPNKKNPRKKQLNKSENKYIKKRLNKERMMNCGLKAKIIKYRKANDIDIQFEDGIIVKNKTYDSFKKGTIAHPNKSNNGKNVSIRLMEERLNEIAVMNCGLKAKIIKYRKANDIDIQFEDGVIVKHKAYSHFKLGNIRHPYIQLTGISYNEIVLNYYLSNLGFRKIKNNEFKKYGFGSMELDLYAEINGIKIAIEYDGYVKHTEKLDEKKNSLCMKNNIKLIRIRELQLEKYNFNGVKMFYLDSGKRISKSFEQCIKNVINYINKICNTTFDLEINFIKHKTNIEQFLSKNSILLCRVGESRKMNNGQTATIIEYFDAHNITIKFEDNTIVKHKRYDSFKKGNIAHPINDYHGKEAPERLKKERIGEEKIMNCGLKAKIINYYNSMNIDVQFEDGLIVEHRNYADFKRGGIGHLIKKNN